MADFNSVLDKAVGDIEKPRPKPVGTYLGTIQGVPAINKVGAEEHQVVDFRVKLMSAMQDVDQEALSECPPISDWSSVQDRLWVNTEQAQFYFQEFMKNVLGFETGTNLRQALAESAGRQYLLKMRSRPYINREGQPDIAFEVESRAHA